MQGVERGLLRASHACHAGIEAAPLLRLPAVLAGRAAAALASRPIRRCEPLVIDYPTLRAAAPRSLPISSPRR